MRPTDRLKVLNRAMNDQKLLQIEADPILNNQEYRTKNWQVIGPALAILIERGWFSQQQSSAEKYIKEMLETRPPSREYQFTQDQYDDLRAQLSRYCSSLPDVMQIIEKEYRPKTEEETQTEFAVELGDFKSTEESARKIQAIFHLFGQTLAMGTQPRFKAVESGSNWLIFEVDEEFLKQAILGTMKASWEFAKTLAEQIDRAALRLIAEIAASKAGEPQKTITPDELDAIEKEFTARLTAEKKADLIKQWAQDLNAQFPDRATSINENSKKADLAIDEITALSSNGVQFQIPEQNNDGNQVIVVGDNNVIVMPPMGPRSLPIGHIENNDGDTTG